MTVPVWTDRRMLDHQPGPGHPERPARLEALLAAVGRLPFVELRAPTAATTDQLALVHDPAYVSAVLGTRGTPTALDPDTVTSEGSVDAALLAAGAVIAATRAVLDGPARRAVALVRPPGHHAERARAMGFCLFNNVAVAAATALARPEVERVAIVDWDVHHGNGTQHLFEDRGDVLFFSCHEFYGQYPGTGAASETGRGEGAGLTVNVPLRPGDGDDAWLGALRDGLGPALAAFRPDLVLVSAGFDAHADDPLGGLRVSDAGFRAGMERVLGLAEAHGPGRVVLALEGGYDLGALTRSVVACLEVLDPAGGAPIG